MLIKMETLNTKKKEKMMKKFDKTRNNYLRELAALRKKYEKSMLNIAVALNEVN